MSNACNIAHLQLRSVIRLDIKRINFLNCMCHTGAAVLSSIETLRKLNLNCASLQRLMAF